MKIIFVNNPHDDRSRVAVDGVLQGLSAPAQAIAAAKRAAEGAPETAADLALWDGEVHVVDFMALRDIVPLRTAPCVLLLFDELEEAGANVMAIKKAVSGALRDLRTGE